MELTILKNIKDKKWNNLIENFETRSLFHQSAWLNFLKQTQKAEIIKFQILEKDKIVGYFVALLEKRGPFKILSSPRPGYNTPHLGPIVNKNFDRQEFISTLDKYCRLEKFDQLEISNPYLNAEIMEKNKFCSRQGTTYLVELFENESKMWMNLKKKSCRYSIHKAEKNDLIVEDTDDPKMINEYYRQLKQVFGKQKLTPTYQKERIISLFNCLKKENLLFSLQVKYEDKIIATGFFPHDNQTVYFFGGASWLEYHYLCPNDLVQWTLMKLAAKNGIKKYDMGGTSNFKSKFGGELMQTYHWYKSYNLLAKIGRSIYQNQFKILQKIKGSICKI